MRAVHAAARHATLDGYLVVVVVTADHFLCLETE